MPRTPTFPLAFSFDLIFKGRLLLFTFLSLCWFQTGWAQDQPAQDTVADKKLAPITILSIPDEALSTVQQLQKRVIPKTSRPVVSETEPLVDTLRENTRLLAELSETLLEEDLAFSFFRSLEYRWEGVMNAIDEPDSRLKSYIKELSEVDNYLNESERRWNRVRELAQEQEATEEIQDRIDKMLESITAAHNVLGDSLDNALVLENQLTELKLEATRFLERFDNQQQQNLEMVITTRNEPLHKVMFESDSTVAQLDRSLLHQFRKEDARTYFQQNLRFLSLTGVMFLLFWIGLRWIRKNYHIQEQTDSGNKGQTNLGAFVLANPGGFALMFTVLISFQLYREMPFLLSRIYTLLFLLPFLMIFRGVVERRLRWSFYFLVALYLASQLAQVLILGERAYRILAFFESIAMGVFLIWYWRHRHSFSPPDQLQAIWFRVLNLISPPFMLIVLIGIISNLIGFSALATLINLVTLLALLLTLMLSVAYISLLVVTNVLLESDIGSRSRILSQHKDGVMQYVKWLGGLAAVLLWLQIVMRNALVLDPVMDWMTELIEYPYDFGALQLSIGDILNFFLVILLTWAISNLVRLLLGEELLSRLDLPRGVPMAISSITQYSLFLIGFLIALSQAGFDLANLGLLAGALGVGIGFGLQNIVGNFISGLILVFERPVTVGDVVNVEGIEGRVTNIGIRASRILQYDGSELIVPNATLISNNVINWSRVQYKRRIILTVNTELDQDPKVVQDLMTEACAQVEYVHKFPQPVTYFQGIEGQSLQFGLYYWVSREILVTKSEVQLKVFAALREAGIQVRIPQRLALQSSTPTDTNGKSEQGEKKETKAKSRDKPKPKSESTPKGGDKSTKSSPE